MATWPVIPAAVTACSLYFLLASRSVTTALLAPEVCRSAQNEQNQQYEQPTPCGAARCPVGPPMIRAGVGRPPGGGWPPAPPPVRGRLRPLSASRTRKTNGNAVYSRN